MNSTVGPYFKVVFLKKKKKKVFAGPVNSARDPQKILDAQKRWTWPLSKHTLSLLYFYICTLHSIYCKLQFKIVTM